MLKGKVWGTTQVLERTPVFEMHRLLIQPGMRCSWHRHERKWNAFICVSGVLFVETRPSSVNEPVRVRMVAGEVTTVPPGEMHRFFTTETGSEALEVYYPDMLSEDIVREDTGGSTA